MRCQNTKRRCVFATPNNQQRPLSPYTYAQTDAQTPSPAVGYRTTDLNNTLQDAFTATSHINNTPPSATRPTAWRLVPVSPSQSFKTPYQSSAEFYEPSTSIPLPTLPGHDTLWSHPALNHAPTPAVASAIASPPRSPNGIGDTPALQSRPTSTKLTTHDDYGLGHDVGQSQNPNLPTDEEMNHLCRFFIGNLLIHIPLLTEDDVGDYGTMVKKKKRLLACTMVYVAARYVPGCKAIRRMLLPDILAILKPLPRYCDDDTRWTTLQAFAVLYNWALPLDIVSQEETGEFDPILNYDTLRVPLDTLARQCSLHKAAEELAMFQERNRDGADIRQTFAFRKYLFSLWLFGVSHFRSLLARSPPRVQPDSAIRSCTRLLRTYAGDDQVRHILAQADLCLIWSQPSHNEWWCSMPNGMEVESTLAVLKNMDESLETWRRTWFTPEQTRSDQLHSLEFQYCFSRFCVSVYVSKLYQSSTSARSSPLLSLSLISKSIERASQSGRLFLDLRPLSKSLVRFRPEDTFGMLALGCSYVLGAHRLLRDVNLVNPGHLNVVRSLAELMVELGLDSKHVARIYGESVLGCLALQLQAINANAPALNHSHLQSQSQPHPHPQPHPSGMQSPEADRTTSAGSKAWMSFNAVSPGSVGSPQMFDLVAAVDEVWPLSPVNLQDQPPAEQRPVWTTGAGATPASQHPTIAGGNATGGTGLGLNYYGSESMVYASTTEGMSYAA
ncbi:hypothetical protein A1O1_07947 [Capronia coronata CBS 617.96]|uniref:Transcription factor domain-containing protein n=1 Tax=Capronia coronata CBS 617.96 TaxID=1182541 RepID=W9XMZ2_9EURO|nr:uncharacterized protein A1O1_07947 [Capronia coronata CBS 617.96]EXJ81882.1 hypothetical protein A1O1_07947 [Capronia coronata CBS 617.96]